MSTKFNRKESNKKEKHQHSRMTRKKYLFLYAPRSESGRRQSLSNCAVIRYFFNYLCH